MSTIDTSLPSLAQLSEQRMGILKELVSSLEASALALARNDAAAVARGAGDQAELCREWSNLESRLRAGGERSRLSSSGGENKSKPTKITTRPQMDWEALRSRIRYLTRMHRSLLRHLERNLAVMSRIVLRCAPTYTLQPSVVIDQDHARNGLRTWREN